MKEFLEQRQDHYLINKIDFAAKINTKNIKEQLKGVLFKSANLNTSFDSSLDFLEEHLENVKEATASLDILEARIEAVKTSIDFILKTRFEIAEDTKGTSVVDLSKGTFNGLMFNTEQKGITFGIE